MLALPSFACGWTLDVPGGVPVFCDRTTISIPVLIGGGEMGLQSVIACIIVPAGGILAYEPKARTVFSSSRFVPDPPSVFDSAGSAAAPGSREAIGVWADFSMHFGGYATADGILGSLTIKAVGLPPGR